MVFFRWRSRMGFGWDFLTRRYPLDIGIFLGWISLQAPWKLPWKMSRFTSRPSFSFQGGHSFKIWCVNLLGFKGKVVFGTTIIFQLLGGFDSTHLKNMLVKIGSFPQLGVKIKTIWNHHPDHISGVSIKFRGFCSTINYYHLKKPEIQ